MDPITEREFYMIQDALQSHIHDLEGWLAEKRELMLGGDVSCDFDEANIGIHRNLLEKIVDMAQLCAQGKE
jgi:hypothetical protein